MPPRGAALRLSRLLDRREPEDGLQGALPGIGTAGRWQVGPVCRRADHRQMTIGILQSTLFGDMFGTAAMRAVFGEPAFLARCAEVEAALARAQARLGIVPQEAAAAISAAVAAVAANPDTLDLARLRRETETVGYPILPLVRQLAERAG